MSSFLRRNRAPNKAPRIMKYAKGAPAMVSHHFGGPPGLGLRVREFIFSFLIHAAAIVCQIFAVLQLIRIFGFTSALIRSATHSSNARPGPCNES